VNTTLSIVGVVGVLVAYLKSCSPFPHRLRRFRADEHLLAVTKTLGVFRPRPKTVPCGSGPAVSRNASATEFAGVCERTGPVDHPLARASRAQLCWPASWGIKVPLGPVCVYADRLDAPRVGSLPFAHFTIDPSEASMIEIASARRASARNRRRR
jgi:hypothetical protein